MKRKPLSSGFRLTMMAAAAFAAFYIAGCIIYGEKGFALLQNFLNILNTHAALVCVACGMTCVMVTGGLDLSVGSLVALDCMILAAGMEKAGLSPALLAPLVLALGAGFGLLQGCLIECLRLHPVVVTLAGMWVCRGLTAVISTDTINIASESWFKELSRFHIVLPFGRAMASGRRGFLQPYISAGFLIALAVLMGTFLLMRLTRLGRSMYAVGSGKADAVQKGPNPRRTRLLAYTLCGFLTSIGGILYCLNTMYGTATQALGLEMKAISSAIIGGTLVTGGVGNVFGSFIGVLVNGTVASLVSYNTDWAKLAGNVPNIAAAVLAVLFMTAQAAVMKRLPWQRRKSAPREADAPSFRSEDGQ